MRSSIDPLPNLQKIPKYSPQCIVGRPVLPLPNIVICVAKENPSEQQTYLNIDLVMHHQNNPQRAAPIRKSAQVKKFVRAVQKEIPTESENV